MWKAPDSCRVAQFAGDGPVPVSKCSNVIVFCSTLADCIHTHRQTETNTHTPLGQKESDEKTSFANFVESSSWEAATAHNGSSMIQSTLGWSDVSPSWRESADPSLKFKFPRQEVNGHNFTCLLTYIHTDNMCVCVCVCPFLFHLISSPLMFFSLWTTTSKRQATNEMIMMILTRWIGGRCDRCTRKIQSCRRLFLVDRQCTRKQWGWNLEKDMFY